MPNSRIRNHALSAEIDEGQIAWQRYAMPITEHYCRQISQRDYRGKRLAVWSHIRANDIAYLLALHQAGARVAIGACNVDSTDDAAAAYLASKGITVLGWQGMSLSGYEENLRLMRGLEAEYLCDMGGELIEAYLDKVPAVIGALEATTSGLNHLRERQIPFPVFDWNSIPLKEQIENRIHVGDGLWTNFSSITGMTLFGRRVLVVGYGPVGKGIAERARALGATVYVADLDPVRMVEARHHGNQPLPLEDGLARCQIIVTATGAVGVLGEHNLERIIPGAILLNAGHTNREIDTSWLNSRPHKRMRPNIEHYNLEKTHLYLLARGSLLNLAGGAGSLGMDIFDHFSAVMLLGISWMFDGIPAEYSPGLQRFPRCLEQEIANTAISLQR